MKAPFISGQIQMLIYKSKFQSAVFRHTDTEQDLPNFNCSIIVSFYRRFWKGNITQLEEIWKHYKRKCREQNCSFVTPYEKGMSESKIQFFFCTEEMFIK